MALSRLDAAAIGSIVFYMFKALAFSFFLLASGPVAGPSDEMFEKLLEAPSESEAEEVAMDIFAAWMESGSPTVDILMERGVEAQLAGELDLARAMYDRAILIKPDYAEAWNRRAALFLAEENYAEALRDVNEALRLEPRHFGAWTGLGAVLETFGAREEALQAYREALKIHPWLAPARQGEGRLATFADGQAL